MANTLLTPTIIAKEALMQLDNNCVMADQVHRKYKKEFVKIGETVTVRKPVEFVANDGSDVTSQIQDVTEQSTTFTVDQRKNVAWSFSTQDLTMTIEDYSERYIKPATIQLANKLDSTLATTAYQGFNNLVGTPGTTPASFSALADAGKRLDNNSVPGEMRNMTINPDANWTLSNAFHNLYNQQVANAAIRKGQLSNNLAGFDIRMDQNIQHHTIGTGHGTPLIAGASQTGASLAVDGLSTSVTGAVAKGDKFTIAGVYAVNHITKATTSRLMQFTVTAAADSDGTGAATLSISPSITTSGAYQTVSAGPADNAALTFVAAYDANLAFHRNAVGLVVCPLAIPDGATFGARASHNGLSIRIIKGFDILTDKEIVRLDIFYGTKVLDPRLGTVLAG